jgi:hypothetical protein
MGEQVTGLGLFGAHLLLDLDFLYHSDVIVPDLRVGNRHFAVQHIAARGEFLSQPDHARNVVIIECATERLEGCLVGVLSLGPAMHIRRGLAVMEAKEIELMHRWPRRFDPNHLGSFA